MADGGKDRETRIRDILDGITLFERVQVRGRAPRQYKRVLEYLSRYGVR